LAFFLCPVAAPERALNCSGDIWGQRGGKRPPACIANQDRVFRYIRSG
jgi:hypothetical protein